MKNFVLFLFTLFTSVARAGAFFEGNSQRALIYYMQGDNVNASTCENITEEDLKAALEQILKTKCNALSANGLSKEALAAKLPGLKEKLLAAFDGEVLTEQKKMIDQLNEAGQIESAKRFLNSIANDEKKGISSVTVDELFAQYQLDGTSTTITTVSSREDLDKEINNFSSLTK